MQKTSWKDYKLRGAADGAAEITDQSLEGRVAAEWFSCAINRKALKNLIRRKDAPALRNFGLWLGLMATSGVAGYFLWGTLWAIPAFAIYGILYSTSDHRAHELSHNTPFRTRWLNEFFYHLCAFMTLHEAYYWRWSHSRHHTHTIIVGRDPEIAVPRPPDIAGTLLDLFFLKHGIRQIGVILRNATGYLTEEGRHFVPESEQWKVIWSSRAYVAIFVGTIAWCIAIGSILPAMYIVLPRFYGGPLSQVFNITQHAGLNEDVYDHRQNTRTVYMKPVFSFLYMNMNYHIEHHMFPIVPFYALPALHELIKDQCPPAYPGLWVAYREIVPALMRQCRDPSWYITRPLPESRIAAVAAE
jgi:fatty acid desaturase